MLFCFKPPPRRTTLSSFCLISACKRSTFYRIDFLPPWVNIVVTPLYFLRVCKDCYRTGVSSNALWKVTCNPSHYPSSFSRFTMSIVLSLFNVPKTTPFTFKSLHTLMSSIMHSISLSVYANECEWGRIITFIGVAPAASTLFLMRP